MRRIILAGLVMLAFAALLPASVTAAPKMRCTLAPNGSGHAEIVFDTSTQRLRLQAMWMATVDCPGSRLHGETAELVQTAMLRPLGNGMVGGPTRISIEFTGAGLRTEFDGQLRGTASFFDVFTELSLDVHASSAGGAKLRGEEMLVINHDTGKLESFTPGFFDVFVADD